MRVTIIGHFAEGQGILNGQTVKTKSLYEGLRKYTDNDVSFIDTYGWSKHPFETIRSIKRACEKRGAVIMLPAHNGVRVIPLILSLFRQHYGNRLYYDVIGGWLPVLLTGKRILARILKGFDGIWVETASMREALLSMGFANVEVVPNFKELTPLRVDQLSFPEGPPLRLCTFSRVMKEKGIEDAIEVVERINQEWSHIACTLDIYGQIEKGYEDSFHQIIEELPCYIRYMGCVDSNRSVDYLRTYDALLFPTYYEGEGFAGTLIDAFSAGVPVIASDWKYNGSIVSDRCGYRYPARENYALYELLMHLLDNPHELAQKSRACLDEAYKYQAAVVIESINHMLAETG